MDCCPGSVCERLIFIWILPFLKPSEAVCSGHTFLAQAVCNQTGCSIFFFKKYLFLLASRLLFLKIHMAFYRYGSNFQIGLSKNSSNGNILGENHNVATEAHRVLFY